MAISVARQKISGLIQVSCVSASPEDRWRGTSSDERAGERRERLIAACHEIVGTEGASALAVRAVCRAANVSPRHFYESFDDADALLLATYERAVQQLRDAIGAAVADSGAAEFEDRLRTAFETAANHLEAHPESGRIIFREALTNDVLRARGVVALPAFVGGMRPRRHLDATLLSGGLAAAFIEWLSGTGKFTRDELVTYCTKATLTLLSMELPE
nr:TetR/AcrR family transcriptional regulator [Mycolicibacterium sp. BK634]